MPGRMVDNSPRVLDGHINAAESADRPARTASIAYRHSVRNRQSSPSRTKGRRGKRSPTMDEEAIVKKLESNLTTRRGSMRSVPLGACRQPSGE